MNSILEFVDIMEREDVRADIVGDRFQLSASSMFCLLNLVFHEPYELVLYENDNKRDKILKKISNYIVE